MRKRKVDLNGKQEVILQLVKEPVESVAMKQPVDFKKPADFANALMEMDRSE